MSDTPADGRKFEFLSHYWWVGEVGAGAAVADSAALARRIRDLDFMRADLSRLLYDPSLPPPKRFLCRADSIQVQILVFGSLKDNVGQSESKEDMAKMSAGKMNDLHMKAASFDEKAAG